MQAARRRCNPRPSSYVLFVEFPRRSCGCTLRSLTRTGPLSALFYATCGTRQIMPSFSTALVRPLLYADIFAKKIWERPHWSCSCSPPSREGHTPIPPSLLPVTWPILSSSPAPRLTRFQPITPCRVGRAPMRHLILLRLSREPLFASDPTAAHNMLSSRCVY